MHSDATIDSTALSRYWHPSQDSDLDTSDSVESFTRVLLGDENVREWLEKTVRLIQDLISAERVFLFDAKGTTARDASGEAIAAVELGDCVYSADFDREPISRPENKVPRDILERSLKSSEPVWALDTRLEAERLGLSPERVSRAAGFVAVPLSLHGICHGLLYVEHRFKPLAVERDSVNRLVLLLRSLAARQALEKLETENRTLWHDILELRRRLKAAESMPLTLGSSSTGTRKSEPDHDFLGDYSMIVGSSEPMHEIFRLLDRIRESNAPVLINGESGTGKELIANAIHRNSPRNGKSFVSENCAALTETLLESELFGYVRGAFTGASRDHKGLFEHADGGTLFLDEVGDMSPNMQKKLLRAVQEGVVRRVGGKEYVSVDVRIISATNKDLLQEVRRGNFREDLYYRLNVINIKLPPLRERREDIPDLIEHFLGELCREAGVEKTVDPEALRIITQYAWPGNIRELQNEVKRLFALSDQRVVPGDLSDPIRKGSSGLTWSAFEEELQDMTIKDAVEKVERALIKRALLETHGNKSQVAKRLQIPKTSLYNKISKYRLEEEIQSILF